MEEYLVLARAKYPNIPDDILNAIATQWAETGDPKIAIANNRFLFLENFLVPGYYVLN